MNAGLKSKRGGGGGGGGGRQFKVFPHTFNKSPLGFSVKDAGEVGACVGKITNSALPLEMDDLIVGVSSQNVSKLTRKEVVARIKSFGFPLKITFKRVPLGQREDNEALPPPKKIRIESPGGPKVPKKQEHAPAVARPPTQSKVAVKQEKQNKRKSRGGQVGNSSNPKTVAQIQARSERFSSNTSSSSINVPQAKAKASTQEVAKAGVSYYNPLPNCFVIQQRAEKLKGTKTYSNYGGVNFEVIKGELDLTKVCIRGVQY
jgi:hypothetical protein